MDDGLLTLRAEAAAASGNPLEAAGLGVGADHLIGQSPHQDHVDGRIVFRQHVAQTVQLHDETTKALLEGVADDGAAGAVVRMGQRDQAPKAKGVGTKVHRGVYYMIILLKLVIVNITAAVRVLAWRGVAGDGV